jgi:Protein of unknown function (DUF3551)
LVLLRQELSAILRGRYGDWFPLQRRAPAMQGFRFRRECRMETIVRTMSVVGALLAMILAGTAAVQAGPWCAWYDPYTYNCGFHSLKQCQATIFGDSSAYCAPNPRGGNSRRRGY